MITKNDKWQINYRKKICIHDAAITRVFIDVLHNLNYMEIFQQSRSVDLFISRDTSM